MHISWLFCFALALVLCLAYGAEEELEAQLNSEVQELKGGHQRPKKCKKHDDCTSSYDFCQWGRCRKIGCYNDWRCKGFKCDRQKGKCTRSSQPSSGPSSRPTSPRPTRPTRPHPSPFCKADTQCKVNECCLNYGRIGFCRRRPNKGEFCFSKGCECADGYECKKYRCRPEEGSGDSEGEESEDED